MFQIVSNSCFFDPPSFNRFSIENGVPGGRFFNRFWGRFFNRKRTLFSIDFSIENGPFFGPAKTPVFRRNFGFSGDFWARGSIPRSFLMAKTRNIGFSAIPGPWSRNPCFRAPNPTPTACYLAPPPDPGNRNLGVFAFWDLRSGSSQERCPTSLRGGRTGRPHSGIIGA